MRFNANRRLLALLAMLVAALLAAGCMGIGEDDEEVTDDTQAPDDGDLGLENEEEDVDIVGEDVEPGDDEFVEDDAVVPEDDAS